MASCAQSWEWPLTDKLQNKEEKPSFDFLMEGFSMAGARAHWFPLHAAWKPLRWTTRQGYLIIVPSRIFKWVISFEFWLQGTVNGFGSLNGVEGEGGCRGK